MLRRVLFMFFSLLIGSCVGCSLLFVLHDDPSTEALDKDLALLNTEIEKSDIEDKKYSGGLIKATIELRTQILKTTIAMLEQKRFSLIRRIDLRYYVNGVNYIIGEDELKRIQEDIASANLRIRNDELEEQRFSGGLVQSLAAATVATDRLSLSQLECTYYTKKYGLLFLGHNGSIANNKTSLGNRDAEVKDKDAL